jgi:1,4-dihydroxy-2-naphthoyl-CoA synthase
MVRLSSVLAGLSRRLMSTTELPQLDYIKMEKTGTDGRVGLVTLNRPKALNALFNPLMNDLLRAVNHFDQDPTVGAIVLTGILASLTLAAVSGPCNFLPLTLNYNSRRHFK